MALTLGDNFSYQGAKPLDARLKYETVAAMKAVADATMYDGCLAYCAGTDKTYQWKSGNTVDETTGKWREFTSGGGGGGGETYTAGDGIDISAENEISTEKSKAGWMDEVIEKVPMSGSLVNIANAFNRSDLYSTTERVIGQWIDGKPIYQTTVNFGSLSNKNEKIIEHGIANIDRIVHAHALAFNPTTGSGKPLSYAYDNGGGGLAAQIGFNVTRTHIGIFNRGDDYSAFNVYVTLQYTKTTDSAIAIGSENEYSTDEKIIGSWIDGKPVYQKTITGTTGSSSNQDTYTPIGASIDKVVCIKVILLDSRYNQWTSLPREYYNSGGLLQNFATVKNSQDNSHPNSLRVYVQSHYESEFIATIQYTKTT